MSDAPYREAPYRDAVDPLGPRLHRCVVHRTRGPAPPPVSRVNVAIGVAFAGVYALAGELVVAASIAAIFLAGTTGAAIDARARRVRCVVDVHAHGLRIDGVELRFDDLHAVTLAFTGDQRRARARRVRLEAATGAPLTVRGGRDLGLLAKALEQALGDRGWSSRETGDQRTRTTTICR